MWAIVISEGLHGRKSNNCSYLPIRRFATPVQPKTTLDPLSVRGAPSIHTSELAAWATVSAPG
jgi:hypothetical protein